MFGLYPLGSPSLQHEHQEPNMSVYHYSHKSDVTLKKTNEMFDEIPSETFFEVAVAVLQAHAWRLVIVVLMVLMHRTMCYLRRLCSLWFLAAVMADTAHPWLLPYTWDSWCSRKQLCGDLIVHHHIFGVNP